MTGNGFPALHDGIVNDGIICLPVHLCSETVAGLTTFNCDGIGNPDLVAGDKQLHRGGGVGNSKVEDGLVSIPLHIAYAER